MMQILVKVMTSEVEERRRLVTGGYGWNRSHASFFYNLRGDGSLSRDTTAIHLTTRHFTKIMFAPQINVTLVNFVALSSVSCNLCLPLMKRQLNNKPFVTAQNVIIAAKCNTNAKCNNNRRKM